jgi:hypothetical protein
MEKAMIDLQLLVSAMERAMVLKRESEKDIIKRGTECWNTIREIRTAKVKRTSEVDAFIRNTKKTIFFRV